MPVPISLAVLLAWAIVFPSGLPGGGAEVSVDALRAHVTALTQVGPPRNCANVASLDRAADYILAEFGKTGAKSWFQYYSHEKRDFKNVVLQVNPGAVEWVVVGAHYDVCGELPGADDNASGVAGLLELARLLVPSWPAGGAGLELVAYTAEEPPYFGTGYMGSAGHAHYLAKQGKKVRAMIALEMIGYFTDVRHSQRYPLKEMSQAYPDTGNFIAVAGRTRERALLAKVKAAMTGAGPLPVETIAAPASVKGVDFSDHRNYWEAGYPAIMVTDTAFYRNPNYHTAGDTIETLDFPRMAEVVNGVRAAIMEIING